MKQLTLFAMGILAAAMIPSCGNSSTESSGNVLSGAEIVEDIPTIQAFTMEAIPDGDIVKLLNAGINSASGMNSQPWHFTAIASQDIIQGIVEAQKNAMPSGMPPMPKDGEGASMPPMPSHSGPHS